MNDSDILKFISQLEEALEAESHTLQMETVLDSLPNWDSMSYLAFMAMMDSEYDVQVQPAKLVSCKTVRDLADLIPTNQ